MGIMVLNLQKMTHGGMPLSGYTATHGSEGSGFRKRWHLPPLYSFRVDLKSVVFACWSILATNAVQDRLILELFLRMLQTFLLTEHSKYFFQQLVITAARMEATDPRDKLFALIGLAVPEDQLITAFQPDYSQTVVEVYTRFTRYIATNPVPTPLWEFYKERSDPFNSAANPEFPTWVVRHDRHGAEHEIILSKPGWQASREALSEVYSTDDSSILQLKGFEVCPISFSDHSLHSTARDSGRRVRVLWPNVAAYLADRSEACAISQATKKKLILAVATGGLCPDVGDDPRYFDDIVNRVSIFDRGLAPLPDKVTEMFAQLQVAARSKSFFILEDGRMGPGPNATEPGGVVVVIFGHPMPYVLRPVVDKFLFLGPCYVNDIMEGQLMDGLKSGKYKEEWLTLR